MERGFTRIANVGGKALRVFFDWWSGVSHGSPTWQEDLCFLDWFEGREKFSVLALRCYDVVFWFWEKCKLCSFILLNDIKIILFKI